MNGFAQVILARPLVVVALATIATAVAALPLPGLGRDEDVLRFLPADDPEVRAFRAITLRFPAMEVALVAVEAEGPDADGLGLYTAPRLTFLRQLSRAVAALPEVQHVTSIADLAVVTRGEEGAAHVALVPPEIPTDAAGLLAVRERVLAQDYLQGLLTSADGTTAALVVQLRPADPEAVAAGRAPTPSQSAARVRAAILALERPAGVRVHLGGAPFISEAAARGSQADLARLGPFVGGLMLVVITLGLGSLVAVLWLVVTVGAGIVWTLGVMAAAGLPMTLVSSALPVILVALGSAHALHLLTWHRRHGADVHATLAAVGPPIVTTALATAAVFLGFLLMDTAPLRELGALMALGAVLTALAALTLLPALLALVPGKARAALPPLLERALVAVAHAARRRAGLVVALALAVAVGLGVAVTRVEPRSDPSTFFDAGSPPAEANRVMIDKLGGSVFLQILVDGDIGDPAVLHRVAAFEDRLRAVPGTTRPQGITDVLAVVHEGLKGERRLSRARDETEQLGFLAAKTDPSVSLLLDKRWRGALIQVGLGRSTAEQIAAVTPAVRELAARHLAGEIAAVPRDASRAPAVLRDAAERIAALTGREAEAARLEAALSAPLPDATRAALAAAVDEVVKVEVIEGEMVALADPAKAPELTRALAAEAMALTLDRARFDTIVKAMLAASELADAEQLDRSLGYLFTQLDLAVAPKRRADLVARLTALTGPLDPGRRERLAAIADEVLQPTWYVGVAAGTVPGATPVTVTVSGQPVIQQAMADSARANVLDWLVLALPLALAIVLLATRSGVMALVALVPPALTLLAGFGLMGLFPEVLPLDLASCMLAAMALGVGLDQAVHQLHRLRAGGLEDAARTAGRSALVTSLEIAGGFAVLALAEIAPVARFGLLTAVTLVVAAVATLVLLPALTTWWNPQPVPAPPDGPMES